MRMLIQSKKVQKVIATLLNYPQKIKCITVDEMEEYFFRQIII